MRRVAAGGSVLDPAVVAQMLGRRRDQGLLAALTEREREVLELIAEGRTNRAICDQLYLSERAVERRISSIFSKLDLPASEHDQRRVLAALASSTRRLSLEPLAELDRSPRSRSRRPMA